jgi:galactonate dehydratase
MKITAIDTFVVDTGFTPPRPWLYCAVHTGYSEFGSPGLVRGLLGLVADLGERLMGKDPTTVEKHYIDLYRHTRQASYGATQMAIAGLELALWDVAAKRLGYPCGGLWVDRSGRASACTGHIWPPTGSPTGSC